MPQGYTLTGGSTPTGSSWLGLSAITDTFWAIVNVVVLFFQTLVNPSLTKASKSASSNGRSYSSTDYRRPGDGPPAPPRRFGGFHNRKQGGPSAPPMAGGG
ncbi:selenoprotein K-like [Sycon ciliatum]|uniref:selenoprotein K-like n=1 Tax=Sycon ciliatum TaxID=27933 RepID=UPI0020A8CCAA